MMRANKIKGGLYLVVDPSMPKSELLHKTELACKENPVALQIWDNFNESNDESIIREICQIARKYNIDVLINNRWELLMKYPLSGVHFDKIPKDWYNIKMLIDKDFKVGITCGNDLATITWAEEQAISYISFCSVFPSSSADNCEIIDFDIIRKAKEICSLPIFLAGGITTENISMLSELPFDGIAVISGVFSKEDSAIAVKEFQNKLKSIQK